jgi:hypothetical protein
MKSTYKTVLLLIIASLNITIFIDGVYRLSNKKPILNIPTPTAYGNIIVGSIEMLLTLLIIILSIYLQKIIKVDS